MKCGGVCRWSQVCVRVNGIDEKPGAAWSARRRLWRVSDTRHMPINSQERVPRHTQYERDAPRECQAPAYL